MTTQTSLSLVTFDVPLPLFPDPIKHTGLRAVELLIPLTVFVRKLNSKFQVRAMQTCVSIDLAAADAEDALQRRYVFKKKRNTSAASSIHQRPLNNRRRPASYTFHNFIITRPVVAQFDGISFSIANQVG